MWGKADVELMGNMKEEKVSGGNTMKKVSNL